MALVHTLQVLGFVFVTCSFVNASYDTCGPYSSQSCDSDQVCCNDQCVDGSNCEGRFCYEDSNCASDESCCNNYCRHGFDCIGSSCSSSSNCKASENCCDGICQSYYDCDYDPTPIIVASVVASLILTCMISMCIFYACRRRRPLYSPGRVIVGARVGTTVATARHVQQAYLPYPGGPQSYQQGYPYYPPNQYHQHQTAAPSSYSQVATSEPPHPYNPGTQGNPGGVYSPQTSYGAVKTGQLSPV